MHIILHSSYEETLSRLLIKQINEILSISIKSSKIEYFPEFLNFINFSENKFNLFTDEKFLNLMISLIRELSTQRLPMAKKKFNALMLEILPFHNFSDLLHVNSDNNCSSLLIKMYKTYFKAAAYIGDELINKSIALGVDIIDSINCMLNMPIQNTQVDNCQNQQDVCNYRLDLK